jgi:hypothetical protein
VQFSAAQRHLNWVLAPEFEGERTALPSALCALRPGADHVFRHLGKFFGRQPSFRYRLADAGDNPSGWIQTQVRVPVRSPPGYPPNPHPQVRRFLQALRRQCEARGIRVLYSLPWAYARQTKSRRSGARTRGSSSR